MTTPIGFPPGTVYSITNVTQGKPGVVTLSSVALPTSFYIVNGMTITISGVKGMRQLNQNRFHIGNLDTNAMTFQLYDENYNPVDTSQYNAYVSGGQINIISYPPQAGSPAGLMYNNQTITI